MKTFAFKVHRPDDQRELFLVCESDQPTAHRLLEKSLKDPDWRIEDARELQDGLAQFLGLKPGEVGYWAPFGERSEASR